ISCPPIHIILFTTTYTSTSHIYTLSLHDALPISLSSDNRVIRKLSSSRVGCICGMVYCFPFSRTHISVAPISFHPGICTTDSIRSEEHTSELQSRFDLVCRLLLEKKKQ